MYQQPLTQAFSTDDILLTINADDQKLSLQDVFTTLGQAGGALGLCVLLHSVFM